MRHREAKQPVVVVGIALGRQLGDRQRFPISRNGLGEFPFRLAHLADLVNRLRPAIQLFA